MSCSALLPPAFVSRAPLLIPKPVYLHAHFVCNISKAATSPSLPVTTPKTTPHHTPVLPAEVNSFFPAHIPTFLDCTVGAGGHAHQLLSHRQIDRYIALDKDPQALQLAETTLADFNNVQYKSADFRNMRQILQSMQISTVDAILLDIGTSSMQLDQAARGFSFARDGPIDMRMSSSGLSAHDLLQRMEEEQLSRIFWDLGEERMARRIAKAICQQRDTNPIESTKQLADLVLAVKGWRKKGVHPATQVFQALRIATNDELTALEEGLMQAVEIAAPHARIAVICFHSLEDRIAKRVFKSASDLAGGVRILTKKPIIASDEECRANPRARSAKLRVVERLPPGDYAKRKKNKYPQ